MRIIYVEWNCFGGTDLLAALRRLGHEVSVIALSDRARVEYDAELSDKLVKLIESVRAELVISFNYYPSISDGCMRAGTRYFSWIYDSPYVKAYDASIVNNVNYIGTFDSFMADELNKSGVATIHYMPLAVNVVRIEQLLCCETQSEYSDISFVGSLYNDKNNFYERMFAAGRDVEFMGYLDAVIEAQRKLYGVNILEECLDDTCVEKIENVMPYKISEGSYINKARVYADYYLAPRATFLDRRDIITGMSMEHNVDYYTYTDYKLGKAVNKGRVDYYTKMPQIFNGSVINLNISLRSIRKGIPLRAMDIMGAGGFLLTNYQEDMFRHFEPGKHFDYYTLVDEAVDKADYYLRHDSECKKMAASAYEEIKSRHTYEVRLREVFAQL